MCAGNKIRAIAEAECRFARVRIDRSYWGIRSAWRRLRDDRNTVDRCGMDVGD